MKTIKENKTNELIIKNSRFITKLIKIDSPNIEKYLNQAKEEYKKATHYTYAYIYNDIKHSSDDNEPTGTAGAPILSVLEKEELNFVLCIVIRYFGGIKLGAGGLIRAYTKSVTEPLKDTEKEELEKAYEVIINFNYDQEKDVKYILNTSKIVSHEYSEFITYKCIVTEKKLEKLEKFSPIVLNETYIEKLN